MNAELQYLNLCDKSGIYCITNRYTGKIYIGSSKNITKRWKRHSKDLLKNRHHNLYLQRTYNKYGGECLEYSVVELCDTNSLLEKEKWWIEKLKPPYNIGGVSGGDNFSNHPDKERIREVHRKNIKEMRERGAFDHIDLTGCNNPNWKGGVNVCYCGKEIAREAKSCINCVDKSGDKNSFYGKHHSEITKKIISDKNKERGYVGNQETPIYINGHYFKSLSEGSRLTGINVATLCYRCKSNSYLLYKDCDNIPHITDFNIKNVIILNLNGVESWYKDGKQLCQMLGIKSTLLSYYLSTGGNIKNGTLGTGKVKKVSGIEVFTTFPFNY